EKDNDGNGAGDSESIEALSTSIARLILNDRSQHDESDRPIHLCGYSLGGMIAYEVAMQLRKHGAQVAPLIMFDAFAPGALSPRSKLERLRVHGERLLKQSWRERFAYLRSKLGAAASKLQSDGVTGELPRSLPVGTAAESGPPPTSSGDIMHDNSGLMLRSQPTRALEQRIEQCNRHIRYLARSYVPKSTDQLDLSLIRASNHPEWFDFTAVSEDNGWGPLVGHQIQIRDIDCAHRDMFKRPHVDDVVRHVKRVLQQEDT
ncbi:MAG: thioesterase domain-containing protein, partial [Planctomycetota bacterium]